MSGCTYVSWFPVAVAKAIYVCNSLFWVVIADGESVITEETWLQGAEREHLQPQAPIRDSKLVMGWGYKISKPTHSVVPPPARPHFLNLAQTAPTEDQLFGCLSLCRAFLMQTIIAHFHLLSNFQKLYSIAGKHCRLACLFEEFYGKRGHLRDWRLQIPWGIGRNRACLRWCSWRRMILECYWLGGSSLLENKNHI